MHISSVTFTTNVNKFKISGFYMIFRVAFWAVIQKNSIVFDTVLVFSSRQTMAKFAIPPPIFPQKQQGCPRIPETALHRFNIYLYSQSGLKLPSLQNIAFAVMPVASLTAFSHPNLVIPSTVLQSLTMPQSAPSL